MKPEEPEPKPGHKIQDVADRVSINDGAGVHASFSPDLLSESGHYFIRSNTTTI